MRADADVPVLAIEGLCVELSIGGRWISALNDVNLTVNAGESLGPSSVSPAQASR